MLTFAINYNSEKVASLQYHKVHKQHKALCNLAKPWFMGGGDLDDEPI